MKKIAMALMCVAPLAAQACQFFHDATAKKPEDNWGKMKDCAAQAEKLAKGWEGDTYSRRSYTSHYSPRYNRCYVIQDILWPSNQDQYLWDAFENTALVYTRVSAIVNGAYMCQIYIKGHESGNCSEVSKFIDDHMNTRRLRGRRRPPAVRGAVPLGHAHRRNQAAQVDPNGLAGLRGAASSRHDQE